MAFFAAKGGGRVGGGSGLGGCWEFFSVLSVIAMIADMSLARFRLRAICRHCFCTPTILIAGVVDRFCPVRRCWLTAWRDCVLFCTPFVVHWLPHASLVPIQRMRLPQSLSSFFDKSNGLPGTLLFRTEFRAPWCLENQSDPILGHWSSNWGRFENQSDSQNQKKNCI